VRDADRQVIRIVGLVIGDARVEARSKWTGSARVVDIDPFVGECVRERDR